MTSPTSSTVLTKISPPRRLRTHAKQSNPYGASDTPQSERPSRVKWNPESLIAEMAKSKDIPLSEETGEFLVQDDCFNDLGHGGDIDSDDSDDPTNTAMILEENDEDELKQIPPGTPMAISKLSQLTVNSIRRRRISQTPGRTPCITGSNTGNPLSAKSKSEHGSSSKKHYVDDMGSPSKKGRQAPLESLGSLMPPLQLSYSQSPSLKKSTGVSNIPRSVQIMNSGRRATLLLEKIKNAPLTTGILSPPNDVDVVQQRKRTPIKQHFERNELEPIEFSKLMTTASQGSAIPSSVAINSKQQTPDTRASNTLLRQFSSKTADLTVTSSATGESATTTPIYTIDNNDPMRTPKRKPAEKDTLIDLKTPRTEQLERMQSMIRFFGSENQQGPPKLIIETPKPKRSSKQKDNAVSTSYHHISEHTTSGALTSSLENLARLSPIHTPAKKGNIIDKISFSRSDSEHGDIPDHESADFEPPPMLLLSFSSQTHDVSQTEGSGALERVPFDLGQEYDKIDHASVHENSCADLIDMTSRLSQSVEALNLGMRGQLLSAVTIDADEPNTITAAVERANIGSSQPLADAVSCNSPSHSSLCERQQSNAEFQDQVKSLRETMAETKEMVAAIRSELNSQRNEHSSEKNKLDDVTRLLGALDMRLHMVEGQQRQINRTKSTATSLSSVKVPKSVDSPIQAQIPQKDIVGSIGQAVIHYLSAYPLFIVGVLFVVLVSELLFISGIGGQIFSAFKRYIPMPPQQPS